MNVCIVLPGTPRSARSTHLKFWHLLQPIANLSYIYSQLCLSRSRISRISPKSKVYTRHLSFIFYCFLPHISRIFSKSKLFLQSQEIWLRQSWLYVCSFVKMSYQSRFCLQISYPAILFTMLIWFSNRGSFIIHALLPGTRKAFTVSVLLLGAYIHVLLGTQRYVSICWLQTIFSVFLHFSIDVNKVSIMDFRK